MSEKKLEAILKVLPTLQKGLDVNVFFTSPTSFGSSPDSLPAFYLFAMFGVMLCHGWLPDPQAGETYTIVAEKLGSYNDVVDRVVDGKNENASDSIVHEGKCLSSCKVYLNHSNLVGHSIDSPRLRSFSQRNIGSAYISRPPTTFRNNPDRLACRLLSQQPLLDNLSPLKWTAVFFGDRCRLFRSG